MNRFVNTLQYVQKKHIVHEDLHFAVEVLLEALSDWGPRFQEIVSSPPKVLKRTQKKTETHETTETAQIKISNPRWVFVILVYLTIIAGVSSNLLADWISSGGFVAQTLWLFTSVFAALVLAWFTNKKL